MSEETPPPEQSLAEQVANRRASRERIAALGHPLYPNRFDATHLVSDVVGRWGGADAVALEAEPEEDRRVALPGRVLAIRKMGKAVFLDLSDGRRRVQAYVRKDGVGDGGWALLENLDLGDHVGVTGGVFRTRTDELSVRPIPSSSSPSASGRSPTSGTALPTSSGSTASATSTSSSRRRPGGPSRSALASSPTSGASSTPGASSRSRRR